MTTYPTYTIRQFEPADLPRLQEITVQTFGAVSIDRNMEERFGRFGEGGWAARKAAAIAEDCRIQPDGAFVAVDGTGAILGFVTTRVQQASRLGWIPNLAVDVRHQAKGLGRALLERALEFLKLSGMEVAKIETLQQNAVGQKLYPRLGFEPIAKQIHYAMRLNAEGGPDVTEKTD